MDFLRFLEGIRTPFLTAFFSAASMLGEEIFFILLGVIVIWTVNKRLGRYILAIGAAGTMLNQFLKILVRIPRPWVVDPSFTIVESARAGAGGYSFPSGHTQIGVGVFGGIALWTKHKGVRIAAIILAILVPLARMYLGVHTPLDVGVAAVMAVILAFALYPAMVRSESLKSLRAVVLVVVGLAVGFVLYMSLTAFPADVDPDNLEHAVSNAWTLLGAALGMGVGIEIDERKVHYETAATWLGQIVKVVVGLALAMGIRMGLKPLLNAVIPHAGVGNCIRYFCMMVFALGIWPMSFRKLAVLGKKE